MEKSKRFEDFVWQKGYQFILVVYKITKPFSREEIFGLTSQLKKAAGSITTNIAERYKQISYKEKLPFCNISQASLKENNCFLILSRDLNIQPY